MIDVSFWELFNLTFILFILQMQEITQRLLSWDTWLSSKVMASVYTNNKHSWDHPRDPSDFWRCYRLVKKVPWIKNSFDRISLISTSWKFIIENWDKLCELYEEELPKWSAPILYKFMQDWFDEYKKKSDEIIITTITVE